MKYGKLWKRTLTCILTGSLFMGAFAGLGSLSAVGADPADAFSDWTLSGFTPRMEDGEAVLVSEGGTFSEINTKNAVSTAYLEFDVCIDSVNSSVDGNVGASYTAVDDRSFFFEYNVVHKEAHLRLFSNDGGQYLVSKSVTLDNKTWYRFTIVLEEDHLRWYIDDTLVIELKNSYGVPLTGGAWCVQGYNATPRLKNVVMYNSLEGAFPEWNTAGWGRVTENGQHTLIGTASGSLSTSAPVILNTLNLSVYLEDIANGAGFEADYDVGGGKSYAMVYTAADGAIRLVRRVSGGEELLASAECALAAKTWYAFSFVLNDDDVQCSLNGEPILRASDTCGDTLASGTWTVSHSGTVLKLRDLTFANIASSSDVPVKDCDFEFTAAKSVEGFTTANGTVKQADGKLVYTVTGKNSYLTSPTIDAEVGTAYSAKLAVKNTILFRIRNDTDTSEFRIYYKSDRALRYSEENMVTVQIPSGEGFQTVYANLSACRDMAGYLKGFRIVPVGATKGTVTIDAITFEREAALYDYAGEITSCVADAETDTVTVKGTLDAAYTDATIRLYELDIANWSQSVEGLTPSATATAEGREFTVTLPFRNGKITRLTSLFMATVVTASGEVKVSDRFQVENYRDFTENPYAFTLPDLTVRVTDPQFGAIGDGYTNDTKAIQAAIDYVNAQGGGTVVLEGDDSLYGRCYVASRIQMKDNVELRIETGAILWQSPREEDYDYDVLRGHDMVIPGVNWTHIFLCHNYPLILASECKNVRVTGGGTIRMNDAGGENLDGVDGSSIWTGCECRIHIVPMAFYRCDGVEVSDITVRRANGYLMSLTGSQHAYVGNLTEQETTCASGDGIGLGGAKHILIDRFTIYSNDDAVTLTSSYNDPRGMAWWYATPDENNSVMDVTVKSSYIFSGHGITFIPWGTDAPDLSKQEIRDVEVYDCILDGPYAVGTWPDNPYYGKKPFDNTETGDFSPIVGVRIHDNLYRATATLEWITATDVITDCGITSHNNFVYGNFERKRGKEGWIAGLSNWSYTAGENSAVEAVDVNGDHKGRISGTGSLYQGLHLNAGTHVFTVDTNLTAGAGTLFVRDAVSGEYLVSLPLRWGDKPENKITFALSAAADLELGVELTEAGEVLIDNASVAAQREQNDTSYPDSFTESFESLNTPTFDHSGGIVTEEDGNSYLKVENPNGSPRSILIHEDQKTFDLRFHWKVTDVSSTVDGNVGVSFARADGDNNYFLEYNSVNKYIQLRSFVKGTPTVLLLIPKELKTDEWHLMGLRLKDGKIEVYLDGEKLGEAEANATLRGTMLTFTSYNTGYCLDNVTLASAGELDMSEIIPLKSEAAKVYTLTFNAGGGAPIPRKLVLTEGETPAAVDAPVLDGYEFLGWTLNGEKVDLTTFTMPAADVTLVAAWTLLPSETRPPESETTPAPETDPIEPTDTDPVDSTDTAAPSDSQTSGDDTPAKGGCKSSAGLLILPFAVIAAGLLLRKKKE